MPMFYTNINDHNYQIEFSNESLTSGLINGKPFSIDISSKNQYFHIIFRTKSFKVFVLDIDRALKKVLLKINNKQVWIDISDDIDKLLKSLGRDLKSVKKEVILRAPMPGMIKKIWVKKGDLVKKGDTLLVLEAMKMENNIKATHDSVINDIPVTELNSVEKNQALIIFD